MKRYVIGLFLLAGCADSPKEVPMAKDEAPPANAAVALKPAVPQTAAAKSAGDAAAAHIDAERLLASTLASAKAENKRVMVHLGAPW